ncbi:hypothetical protein [Hymenobacter volaticus]|uniref:DUF4760 domain-containing protein n=1 Tax=Hymenobacter volaticus TaxID=2932254 RepID=A0ABY4GDQ8_9BACT|nr:hypothetical protein [Hymenobacter volaticus]UOQ69045.1 hypothetical protein MUN86_26445 [Hymenobacter volaticus]
MDSSNTQNISTALLIAVVTVFVLPALLKFFEIVFTRGVNRDSEVRNKQLAILEQLTKIVWEWRFLGKQVCYYGCNYKRSFIDNERFQKAIVDYDNRVWPLFVEIKAIKSRAIVWYAQSVPEKIEALYEYIKRDIDAPLTSLVAKSQSQENNLSSEFFKMQALFSNEVSPNIETHIVFIADKIKRLKL